MDDIDFKCHMDLILFGMSFKKIRRRKWYDLSRWIYGKEVKTYISPKDVKMELFSKTPYIIPIKKEDL